MPPQSDFEPRSTLGIVPPASRKDPTTLTVDTWLEEKQDTDGAEGLWRIHDGIYDLTDFVDKHPGGEEWLSITKGTDITEAFEVHHIKSTPEELLKKYFVRNAKQKRNAPFTFKENGFYKTLKREIVKELPNVPKTTARKSVIIIDSLLVLMFLVSILTVRLWSYALGVVAGVLLGMVTIASHNFIHRKNNFRMYYFNFSLQQVREFRISHILSHHLHTNTIDDLELSLLEPLLEYFPVKKSPLKRYGQVLVIAPLVWLTFFHTPFIKRYIEAWKCKGKNLRITDLTSFLLPLAMYLFGGRSFWDAFWMWNYILVCGALHFGFVGLHAAHHHPDIFHDGDVPRSTTDYDWGISQLDAVMDRKEITASYFLVLTNFGDHCLHHMFPTLDHAVLAHLYPLFKRVLNDFDLDLRMVSQWDTITGGFQQLVKITPNTTPPDLRKYRKDN
ncbi:hypothetical protein NQ315_001834 [Exocentrus adspersus]|uniref:Cytochrome b5-related protein n=1 Tax=Exocentrus adspersus TaxID=1586481 RepID=A0AAV8WAC4_9CUCU|nr:hypothetical protein NQ315_001834 [Exocentrus adspersus]